MPDGLPSVVEPVELARAGARLAGSLPLTAMPRLVGMTRDRVGDVRIEIRFGRDPQGRWIMQGFAECVLALECQRCLASMRLPLRAEIRVRLARPGAAPATGESTHEEVLETGAPVVLSELIEDELLLALPMVPMHESADCRDTPPGIDDRF